MESATAGYQHALDLELARWPESYNIMLVTDQSGHDITDDEYASRHPHIHQGWELKFYLGESGSVIRDMRLFLSMPCLLLIPPRCVHHVSDPTHFPKHRLLSLSLEPNAVELGWMYRHRVENCFLNACQYQQLDRLCLGGLDILLSNLTEICQSHAETELGAYHQQLVKLLFLSISSLSQHGPKLTEPPSGSSGVVDQAKQHMLFHYSRDTLTVKEIAEAVRITPNHLAVLFRQQEKRTVRQTLVDIRLEKALQLLQAGDYTVKEVSHLTGWTSQLYFSKCFRKHYGYPPSTLLKKES